VKRRQTLDLQKVEALAESMMEKGQDAPILVRPDGQRFVLVEGLHRLEACKALGETTVPAYLVQARKHRTATTTWADPSRGFGRGVRYHAATACLLLVRQRSERPSFHDDQSRQTGSFAQAQARRLG
jgi:hypothetical protein